MMGDVRGDTMSMIDELWSWMEWEHDLRGENPRADVEGFDFT